MFRRNHIAEGRFVITQADGEQFRPWLFVLKMKDGAESSLEFLCAHLVVLAGFVKSHRAIRRWGRGRKQFFQRAKAGARRTLEQCRAISLRESSHGPDAHAVPVRLFLFSEGVPQNLKYHPLVNVQCSRYLRGAEELWRGVAHLVCNRAVALRSCGSQAAGFTAQ